MTAKKKPATDAVKSENRNDNFAQFTIDPSVQAAFTIKQWQGGTGEFHSLNKALSLQIAEVKHGDMSHPEAMLIMQAHTLNEIFNSLARRAQRQDYLPNLETCLRLALKAQSQCRATLETLAAIKNPPVIYAKQANIANGHQQINNGIPVNATHAQEIKNQPNELLEEKNGGTILDTGTTGATVAKNKAMATLA